MRDALFSLWVCSQTKVYDDLIIATYHITNRPLWTELNANDYDFTNWELYNIKILSEEEQILEYFIKNVKTLTKEIYHPDPRWEEWYYTTEFDNEKAKSLFYELKKYYESR